MQGSCGNYVVPQQSSKWHNIPGLRGAITQKLESTLSEPENVSDRRLDTLRTVISFKYYYYYELQLGCYPVAVVILYVYKT